MSARDDPRPLLARLGVRPSAAVWLAGLGGLLAVLVVAAAAWAVREVVSTDRHPMTLLPTPEARADPPAAVASAADIASLQRVRTIALGQLLEIDHALSSCSSAARVSRAGQEVVAWSTCARWAVAHLEVDGRLNAGIFYAAAGRLPSGRCQRVAMGRANEMMLLADEAHQLLMSAGDRSRRGRIATMQRIAQLQSFVGDVRRHLRRSPPGCRRFTPRHR